jgi:hypothetical protein
MVVSRYEQERMVDILELQAKIEEEKKSESPKKESKSWSRN